MGVCGAEGWGVGGLKHGGRFSGFRAEYQFDVLIGFSCSCDLRPGTTVVKSDQSHPKRSTWAASIRPRQSNS